VGTTPDAQRRLAEFKAQFSAAHNSENTAAIARFGAPMPTQVLSSAAWATPLRALTATLTAPKVWSVEVYNEGLRHTVTVKRQGRHLVGVHENEDSRRVAVSAVLREQLTGGAS
jgi:hypothetical protein